MFETLVKRTIYIAKCTCGEEDIKIDNPPKEKLCKCGNWVTYKEQSSISPEYKGIQNERK